MRLRRVGWGRRPAPLASWTTMAVTVIGLAAACAGGGPGGSGGDRQPVRLADRFAEAKVEGTPAVAGQMARTEWIFASSQESASGQEGASGPSREQDWKALAMVADLRVEDGALRGRSAGPSPLLALDWSPAPEQRDDQIHAIEVRLRASGGGRASFGVNNDEQIVLPALIGNPFAFQFTSPIVPGEEAQLYTLRPVTPVAAGRIRHLLIAPVDAPGVDFAIESVRVVFEREHLASIPAGLSWQGLAGNFRETLVARSPQILRFDLTLPADPYLELAVGTLAPGAVTFEVTIGDEGGAASPGGRRVRRTVTTPKRWEEMRLDLAGLGGKSTQVALRIDAQEPGVLGLWGSPVVRSRVDPAAAAKPQGVVVVLIDTLRRDHLQAWGYDRETAPNLTRLATEGAVADDAIAQAAWTKVSVPSILTSLYPTSHQIVDFPDLLPASAETLAEVFRKAGYATFGFSAIPFTGKMTNLHQGYEQFRETSLELATGGTIEDKAARRYVDELLPWLDRHRDVPFFVLLHVEDPHSPYFAPRPFAHTWADPADPERYAALIEQVRPRIRNPLMRVFGMAERAALEEAGVDEEEFLRYERNAYDALIRSTDAEIARVVERLEELGLRDRVVLASTSDHGTEFLDHGAHFHGHTVYGEINRVPMFFWGPAFVPSGVRIPVTVQNLDFMPTVLELAGLPIPAAAQGQSLRPWFDAGGEEVKAAGKGWRRAPAITEKAYVAAREPGGGYASTSIVSEGWKLIHNVKADPAAAGPPPGMGGGPPAGAAGGAPPAGAAGGTPPPGGGAPVPGMPPGMPPLPPVTPLPEYELYDHAEDPLNLTDLAAQHPDKVKELAEQLARWREKAQAEKLASDAEMAAQASPEELERLRALGYL